MLKIMNEVDIRNQSLPVTVIFVIDVQEHFFNNEYLSSQREQLTKSINELVSFSRKQECLVIWFTMGFKTDMSDAFLRMRRNKERGPVQNTDDCQLLKELNVSKEDVIILKKRYSAFYGTRLDEILSCLQIERVIVAGINTHACVRSTVIDAYQRDYEVILASDCIGSYNKKLHQQSIEYLNANIAEALNNSSIFQVMRTN